MGERLRTMGQCNLWRKTSQSQRLSCRLTRDTLDRECREVRLESVLRGMLPSSSDGKLPKVDAPGASLQNCFLRNRFLRLAGRCALRIETARVTGRLVDSSDAALYEAIYSDADLMRHVGPVLSGPDSIDLHSKVIRWNAESLMRARYWALFHVRSSVPCGVMGVVRRKTAPATGEVGIILLRPAHKTAVSAYALAWLIEGLLDDHWGLGISSVVASHASGNADAHRLVASLGFVCEGQDADGRLSWRCDAATDIIRALGRRGRVARP